MERGRTRGTLTVVLHSHMPYVEGYGTWPFGEEWLWEAAACVYLPLLERLRGAAVTIGLTPVLVDQLETMRGAAGQRFEVFLGALRQRLHAEDAAAFDRSGEHAHAGEARRAIGDYEHALRSFRALGGDLIGGFRRLAGSGAELWTSAATHAVLPLAANEAALALQLGVGVDSHRRRFGGWEGGFWLPECAYVPGLEEALTGYGISAFCVDQTRALGLGALDHLEPIATSGGPVAVPIDWELARLVWDGPRGYPGAAAYRDYTNATDNDLKLWTNDGRAYDHAAALRLAQAHGRDFVERTARRLDLYRQDRGRLGLVCFALDSEILGHWWYEGPAWLETVFELAPGYGIELATVSAALDRHPCVRRELAASTWGLNKDMSTWTGPAAHVLNSVARDAEARLVTAGADGLSASGERRMAAERAVRELLAIQASDWAFMRAFGRAGDYPDRRVDEHVSGFETALAALAGDAPVPDPHVRGLAPSLDVSAVLAPWSGAA